MKKTLKYIASILFLVLAGLRVYSFVVSVNYGYSAIGLGMIAAGAVGYLLIALGIFLDKKWMHVVGALLCLVDTGYSDANYTISLFSMNFFEMVGYLEPSYFISWILALMESYLFFFYLIFLLVLGIARKSHASLTLGIVCGCIAFVILAIYVGLSFKVGYTMVWDVWVEYLVCILAPIVTGIYYYMQSESAEPKAVAAANINSVGTIVSAAVNESVKEETPVSEEEKPAYEYKPEASGNYTYVESDQELKEIELTPVETTEEESSSSYTYNPEANGNYSYVESDQELKEETLTPVETPEDEAEETVEPVKEEEPVIEEEKPAYTYNPEANGNYTYVESDQELKEIELTPVETTEEETSSSYTYSPEANGSYSYVESDQELKEETLTPVLTPEKEEVVEETPIRKAPKLSTEDFIKEMKKLKELMDLGIITKEELEKKKEQFL